MAMPGTAAQGTAKSGSPPEYASSPYYANQQLLLPCFDHRHLVPGEGATWASSSAMRLRVSFRSARLTSTSSDQGSRSCSLQRSCRVSLLIWSVYPSIRAERIIIAKFTPTWTSTSEFLVSASHSKSIGSHGLSSRV